MCSLRSMENGDLRKHTVFAGPGNNACRLNKGFPAAIDFPKNLKPANCI